MRVLNVNHLIDPISGGGTAERTFQLTRALLTLGVSCTVLTLDIGVTPDRHAALAGAELIALKCLNRRFFVPRITWSSLLNRVGEADVVHLMGHWTVLNALVFKAAQQLGKPYAVCPAGALRLFGRSVPLKRLYNRAVGHALVNRANACIAVAVNELEQFGEYGVERDRVHVLPNGVDPANFQSRDAEGFRARHGLGNNPLVLFVGRLNAIKGPDLLLEAFAALSRRYGNHHLVFAGPDGGMMAILKTKARAQGLEGRVHFIGHISGHDKSDAYHAADLLVIPSRHEAMSIVVLEAGMCATPVLLTDQCGFDEVQTVMGGEVVPASACAIESGLSALLERPDELTVRGTRLRDFVQANFLWPDVARKHVRLFENLVKGAGPS